MDAEKKRAEMFAEYLKLIDVVQGYDGHLVAIKAWSVTASSLAIGVVLSNRVDSLALLVAILLAAAFWLTEAHFKVLQQKHVVRLSRLERALASDETVEAPNFIGSFSRASSGSTAYLTLRRVMFWPHVMFPHLAFIAASALLLLSLLLRR